MNTATAGPIRIAYLATHPIQYQVPLLRHLAADPQIDLTVFFQSDLSLKPFIDPEFKRAIEWDIPLLDGYRSVFLPALGGTDHVSFWRPWTYGLTKQLRQGQFDVVWIHGYMRWFHWMAVVAAKRLGIKILLRDEATAISTSRGCIKRALKSVFFRFLQAGCDGFLAIGTLNAEYYRQYGIEAERIFLVPYTVDNSFFQTRAATAAQTREDLRSALGLQADRPIILYVSKLIERKRAIDLLAAYQRLSPDGRTEPLPYLVYVGEGAVQQALEEQAGALGWNSIRFVGFQNQTELPRYYDVCDVLVLPSIHEPWGLVINEVMNAGRAVIVSDHVGCGPDLVRAGENGYMFPAGNVEALSEILGSVLAQPDRFRAMGQKSLDIINRWSFTQDLQGLKQALQTVLQQRAGNTEEHERS